MFTSRLYRCTRTGRPAGGPRFIEQLQAIVGRPRKTAHNKKNKTIQEPKHR